MYLTTMCMVLLVAKLIQVKHHNKPQFVKHLKKLVSLLKSMKMPVIHVL